MFPLLWGVFDDEIIQKFHESSIRKKAIEEGVAKGETEILSKMLDKLRAMGMSEEDLAQVSQLD